MNDFLCKKKILLPDEVALLVWRDVILTWTSYLRQIYVLRLEGN